MEPSSSANQLIPSNEAQQIIENYISQQCPEFARLVQLRLQGWKNPEGDGFFRRKRQNAAKPSRDSLRHYYQTSIDIGLNIEQHTHAFQVLRSSHHPAMLDLGMAPGGFSKVALDMHPRTRVRAITLPVEQTGFVVQIRHPRVDVHLRDVNSLVADLGMPDMAATHPAVGPFLSKMLLGPDEQFDMVACGCQPTRAYYDDAEQKRRYQATRLTLSQLIIALQHLRHNGTLIIVLNKPEMYPVAQLLWRFSQFSDIQLYKPTRLQAKRSSFYLVASNVRPDSNEALSALASWKQEWRLATLGIKEDFEALRGWTAANARLLLDEFGSELVRLGKPVWSVQAEALATAPFTQ